MEKRSGKFSCKKENLDGIRYGEVELEVIISVSETEIVDDCQWKMMKEAYPKFKEVPLLDIWKTSAREALRILLDTYDLPHPIKVVLKDLAGTYMYTVPAHIGAAVAIGIFELCGSPLQAQDLKTLDAFTSMNMELDLIPNYQRLELNKPRNPRPGRLIDREPPPGSY